MIGGKRRSTKRRSSTRRSSKRRSPKQTSWNRKLQAWRKANKHADGSLPTMKSAMKHCKGKSSRGSKCRKSATRKVSKRRSSKRRSAKKVSKRRSSKRRTSKKRSTKRKSSKRRTSKKRSTKRKSSKRRTSKKRSTKRRTSATRKLRKYYPEFVGKRFEVFHRPQPVFAPAPAPVMQQRPVFGPQTAQAYELRTGKRADGSVMGPEPAPASYEKVSSKGFKLTSIENELKNLPHGSDKANKYMFLAIENMDIDLYNLASYYGGVIPKANVTFLVVDEFIRDLHNLRFVKDSVIGGWKNVDYVLLKKILDSFSEKDLKDYWFSYRESQDLMTLALGQEDKTAVQWLLKNNKYTDQQLDLFSQLPWVKPELKEILKPTTVMGALVKMVGGFF